MRFPTTTSRARPLLLIAVTVGLLASSVGVASALLLLTADPAPSSHTPSISISFPADGGSYNGNGWASGCTPRGICGSASDRDNVARVGVAVLNKTTGKYWDGVAFASSVIIYNTASGTAAWRYSLPMPPDAAYVAYVRATDSVGRTTKAGSPVSVSFSIDTLAPSPPRILDGPPSITTVTTAVFHLADTAAQIDLRCQFDKQATESCAKNVTFAHVSVGDHCLRVFAVDGALNTSVESVACWTVATRAFTVEGDTPGLTYPGVSQPIDLVISNPFQFDLTVTSVDVTIQDETTMASGAAAPACAGAENFRVARAFQGPVTVPARSSRSLSQLGVDVSRWPHVEMLNLARSQDGCKNVAFHLAYSGVGRKRL